MEKNKKQYIDIDLVNILLVSKGIDEKELAKLMGTTLPTIKRFLSGADQMHMSGLVLFKLAKALGVTAHSLLHKDYR